MNNSANTIVNLNFKNPVSQKFPAITVFTNPNALTEGYTQSYNYEGFQFYHVALMAMKLFSVVIINKTVKAFLVSRYTITRRMITCSANLQCSAHYMHLWIHN